jgi:hypothetical protein
LRGALFEDFADRYLPGREPDGRVDSTTAAKHAAMLAGTWVNSRGSRSSFLNAVELGGQLKVGVRNGKLVVPLPGLNGEPRTWVEIAPFVWREADGHQRLAAKVENGRVTRFSFDGVSPFMVFDRAPWYRDTAWLLPLLIVALVALAITALVWPVAAIVRRRYGVALPLDPRAKRAFRLSRIAALAIVAAMLAWAVTLTLMFSSLDRLTARFDGVLWTLEILGTIAFVGGFLLLLWNLRVVWTGHRRWPARVWSIVMPLSALVVLWVAVSFKLISFGVNY